MSIVDRPYAPSTVGNQYSMSIVDERANGALVAATRDGDDEAFAALVHRHSPALYRVALHLLGTPADAEDCVQDTWVTAWRRLDGFRGEAPIGTWLYRIATNEALMQRRRTRCTGSPTGPTTPPIRNASPPASRCGRPCSGCRSSNGPRSYSGSTADSRTKNWPTLSGSACRRPVAACIAPDWR